MLVHNGRGVLEINQQLAGVLGLPGEGRDRVGVDDLGLEKLDRDILTTIIKSFNGGPVGIETIASAIGEEAITLLKNDAGVLPFDPAKTRKVVVVGKLADTRHTGKGWSAEGKPLYEITPIMGLREYFEKRGDVKILQLPLVASDGANLVHDVIESSICTFDTDAKDAGMRVYVLGVGSVNGAPIPISGTGDYMKDNTGNTVMSALNEEMCKQVAQAGGGAYIHVENNSAAQQQLDNELDKLAKKETTTTVYSEFDEQFQAVGILVLLLLIIEICILDRRNPLLKRISLFKQNAKGQMINDK